MGGMVVEGQGRGFLRNFLRLNPYLKALIGWKFGFFTRIGNRGTLGRVSSLTLLFSQGWKPEVGNWALSGLKFGIFGLPRFLTLIWGNGWGKKRGLFNLEGCQPGLFSGQGLWLEENYSGFIRSWGGKSNPQIGGVFVGGGLYNFWDFTGSCYTHLRGV